MFNPYRLRAQHCVTHHYACDCITADVIDVLVAIQKTLGPGVALDHDIERILRRLGVPHA